MAFFGLFKSKQERDMEGMLQKINAMIFPGGEADVRRDCQRVDNLVKEKIPQDKLKGFVAGCKALLHISELDSDQRFVRSFMTRSEGRISEAEAYAVFAYLEGEARYYDTIALQMGQLAGKGLAIKEMLGNMPWIYSEGTTGDTIPGGYGEFGLAVSNPVPTVSVRGSNYYISRLRHRGRPVEAKRLGSMSSDATAGSVDAYRLSVSGVEVGTVYICPYHKMISGVAPKGFLLAD